MIGTCDKRKDENHSNPYMKGRPCFWWVLGLLVIGVAQNSMAQQIQGSVRDARNDTLLSSAHVWIKNSSRGTVTNEQGRFTIKYEDLPDTLVIRHIGYKTRQFIINDSRRSSIQIKMEPSRIEMKEIVVTPGRAEKIMRRVIDNKSLWRNKLRNYKAVAYSRQTLANDTSIVSINETVSRVYWQKGKGHREVVLSEKKTKNIESREMVAGVRDIPNFYDNEIRLAGYRVIGPTHPDAFSYYDFELVDRRSISETTVYVIELHPKRNLVPAFKGRVFVLDEEFALLKVDLKPNGVVNMPRPIQGFDLHYRQQFNQYGNSAWLPVDMRIKGEVKFKMVGLEFPRIHFRQASRITDYQLNTKLPDSLYRMEQQLTYDTTGTRDSLWTHRIDPIPLTREEKTAYQSIDSTYTYEKAFKPEGALAPLAANNDREDGNGWFNTDIGLEPRLRFNRVDAFYLGAKLQRSPAKHWQYEVSGGYSFGYERESVRAEVRYRPTEVGVWAEYHAETDTRYDSDIYGMTFAGLVPLMGYPDYYDYFRNEGMSIGFSYKFPHAAWEIGMEMQYEEHLSLNSVTSYDVFGYKNQQRPNPSIREGRLSASKFFVKYGELESYNLDFSTSDGIKLTTLYSSEQINSDFDFTRVDLEAQWSWNTFLRRRLQPSQLSLYLDAGTFVGDVPPQAHGVVDASLGIFNPMGSMRSISFRPYEGEQYLSLIAEHNFQTIPFELLQLESLIEHDWGLILWGGAARTWLDESSMSLPVNSYRTTHGWHTEIGISINRLLGWLRLDVVRRLDEPSWQVGIGLGQIF